MSNLAIMTVKRFLSTNELVSVLSISQVFVFCAFLTDSDGVFRQFLIIFFSIVQDKQCTGLKWIFIIYYDSVSLITELFFYTIYILQFFLLIKSLHWTIRNDDWHFKRKIYITEKRFTYYFMKLFICEKILEFCGKLFFKKNLLSLSFVQIDKFNI